MNTITRIKILAIGLCAAAALVQAQPTQNPTPPAFAGVAGLQGQAVIDALGSRLPEAALANRVAPEALERILRDDKHARIDEAGRLFYLEPLLSELPSEPGTITPGPQPAATISLDQAFLLHSKAGASKIIYLDFDGYTISGTAWNSNNGGNPIVAPPWDIDGNPSSFGSSERQAIINIWKRVAEDYAMFNVDVTTEYPGETALTRASSSDTAYGVRVLVSPISQYFGQYGGIAYVGAFDDVGDYNKPALVFPENLANGEKYIGEACAHEAGHTLGLHHDGLTGGTEYYQGQGTGDTGWAPIMGNSYYKNLTQWSKGEYTGANNTEDDISIIASFVGYRADDFGNDFATASTIPSTTQFTINGIINGSSDSDMFKFTTGAGTVSISLAPSDLGPDLDSVLNLYNSSGGLIASANPIGALGETLSLGLNAGTYYLQVKATGEGDPRATGYSAYACAGQYTITGTLVASVAGTPPVAVARANVTSGTAPLAVQFDSTSSYDPDGSIVSWQWNFGDGYTSTAANPSHTYASAGTYTATLTVTDNTGMTGSSSVQISASSAANASPVAVISASPISGTAPVSVSFNGLNSYDPDGSIASWQWNFGDGTAASGNSVQHTYNNAGSYTATLTVTDNVGATGSSSVQITVQSANVTLTQMSVASVQQTTVSYKGGYRTQALVRVVDVNGAPVSGATVSGTWSGTYSSSGSATTDYSGYATLYSPRYKYGSENLTVTSVSKSGYSWAQ